MSSKGIDKVLALLLRMHYINKEKYCVKFYFHLSIFLQQPIADSMYLTTAKQEEIQSERSDMAAKTIQAHAKRIMQTMIYARSQRNNHLLSEAAALMTAGTMPGYIPPEQTGMTFL